ncbi:hypothetical protein DFP72DRAFT_861479 [Ephemerocybe angulata]|uniref:Uncharacterized protein n=1 Tax=Ephemerocybe angulata TaxID=980116 RepID=A0A8H6H905_9AGAR|nr:hypothetical protein DFP72DRAFT_861479 [Tulosesus angulatus]
MSAPMGIPVLQRRRPREGLNLGWSSSCPASALQQSRAWAIPTCEDASRVAPVVLSEPSAPETPETKASAVPRISGTTGDPTWAAVHPRFKFWLALPVLGAENRPADTCALPTPWIFCWDQTVSKIIPTEMMKLHLEQRAAMTPEAVVNTTARNDKKQPGSQDDGNVPTNGVKRSPESISGSREVTLAVERGETCATTTDQRSLRRRNHALPSTDDSQFVSATASFVPAASGPAAVAPFLPQGLAHLDTAHPANARPRATSAILLARHGAVPALTLADKQRKHTQHELVRATLALVVLGPLAAARTQPQPRRGPAPRPRALHAHAPAKGEQRERGEWGIAVSNREMDEKEGTLGGSGGCDAFGGVPAAYGAQIDHQLQASLKFIHYNVGDTSQYPASIQP